MSWLKSDRWKAGLALAGMLLLLILMVEVPVSVAGAQERASGLAASGTGMVQATPTVDATVTALNKEKLIQDVAQQQHTSGNWLWSNGAALLSSLIVVIGALLGFLRWQGDRVEAERKVEEQVRIEAEITADNQREAALQTYLDKMSELLLTEHLGELLPDGKADQKYRQQQNDNIKDELKPEYEAVRTIARVRTLTVLRGLDPTRKASVLQFLYESGLVDKNKLIINLNGVDLSFAKLREADLSWADLSEAELSHAKLSMAELSRADLIRADLSGAYLSRANLYGADLSWADLSRANLYGANLSDADLSDANLFEAELSRAELSMADLRRADLIRADLSRADLSRANLKDATSITPEELEKQAKSLKDATMPDGSIHC